MAKADSFYQENILDKNEEMSLMPSLKDEEANLVQKDNHPPLLTSIRGTVEQEKNRTTVFYISDIHLDHKLYKKFGKKGDRRKVEFYINSIAMSLVKDYDEQDIHFFMYGRAEIVIAGDTSHSFEINKIFYRALSRALKHQRAFVVLGNHELWEFDSTEQAVAAYEEFFKKLPNIHLLQNQLYVEGLGAKILKKDVSKLTIDQRIQAYERASYLSQEELINIDPKTLQEYCADSRVIIFGTIGFSPLNAMHNVNTGLYRDTVRDLEEESNLAKEAENAYRKISEALPKNRLIVVSHMPLEDWTKLPHQELWSYFSGHTHINHKRLDETGHVYADNQIGYYGKQIKLKACSVDNMFDLFAYYGNGIYDITETQYQKYYWGFSKYMSGIDKRAGKGTIKMLKNEGVYLFLFETEQGKLFLLEGGKRRALKNNDINYYYNNLLLLNRTISKAVEGIRGYLNQISEFVKHIGGSGRIHGNIVDIDFFNHIMIDIRTGEIMPYFAFSVADRVEYSSLPELLEDFRPDLYKKYIESGNNLPSIERKGEIVQGPQHSTDTSIYRDSNIMLKIQTMLDYNVVRFWNDEIIDSIKANELQQGDHPTKYLEQ